MHKVSVIVFLAACNRPGPPPRDPVPIAATARDARTTTPDAPAFGPVREARSVTLVDTPVAVSVPRGSELQWMGGAGSADATFTYRDDVATIHIQRADLQTPGDEWLGLARELCLGVQAWR